MLPMVKKTDYEEEWHHFFNKIDDYANDDPNKWTSLTFLAYFIKKYESVNEVDYLFTHTKKGPTHSKEMKDASRIWEMFNKGRSKSLASKEDKQAYKIQLVAVLKEYVNWAFDVKFRGRETNITGLGLLIVPNVMNEFLQWRKKNKNAKPKRNQELPKSFLEWIKLNAHDVLMRQQLNVLEDLNSLLNYIEFNKLELNELECQVLNKARELNIFPLQGKLEF